VKNYRTSEHNCKSREEERRNWNFTARLGVGLWEEGKRKT